MSKLTVKQLTEAIKTRKYILILELENITTSFYSKSEMEIKKELKEIETTLKTIESYE